MTEAEWLAGRDPHPLLWALYPDKTSDRKFRLFACACLDMIEGTAWGFELPADNREVVSTARRFADGRATGRERMNALRAATKLVHVGDPLTLAVRFTVEKSAWSAAAGASERVAHELSYMGYAHEHTEILGRANEALADVVRESFGSLHLRPLTFDAAWRTSDVNALASGIYEEGAFDRMPILADALQDAGCDCEEVLAHLRDTSATHVRGCWALDLVLGKE